MQYWIMKTEPNTFSIDDLKTSPKKTSPWDGVRNYQARNFMRDQMKLGDIILIYHSSCKEIGLAGIAKVVKESYPDHTALDESGKYFDPKSSKDNPRWFMVDVKWIKTFKRIISLTELKAHKDLNNLILTKKGNRLSIMPLLEKDYETIISLE